MVSYFFNVIFVNAELTASLGERNENSILRPLVFRKPGEVGVAEGVIAVVAIEVEAGVATSREMATVEKAMEVIKGLVSLVIS